MTNIDRQTICATVVALFCCVTLASPAVAELRPTAASVSPSSGLSDVRASSGSSLSSSSFGLDSSTDGLSAALISSYESRLGSDLTGPHYSGTLAPVSGVYDSSSPGTQQFQGLHNTDDYQLLGSSGWTYGTTPTTNGGIEPGYKAGETVVPLPGAVWLGIIGLGTVAAVRRKRAVAC